jgi:hypothetical protein
MASRDHSHPVSWKAFLLRRFRETLLIESLALRFFKNATKCSVVPFISLGDSITIQSLQQGFGIDIGIRYCIHCRRRRFATTATPFL